jgi:drug/metabolite transporter (DMT)-like permease
MNQLTQRPSRVLIIFAFLAIYIIWGTTYLAIRYGLLGMKPFVLNSLRYGLAAVIMFAWCGVRKLRMPAWKNARVLILSGLLMLVGGTGLVVTGEQYIGSGAAAMIIATEPLMFLLFDRKNYKSYSPATFIGMVLGFTGIFIFTHFATGEADALTIGAANVVKGTLLVLTSALFWVSGTLVLGRVRDNDAAPIGNAAWQHLAGAVGCIFIGVFRGDWNSFHPALVPAESWIGLAWLLFMGSLVAFLAFMFLVKVQPPAVVSTHTYVNPIVAVIAGWLVAGEHIGGPQLMALGMVLLGMLLVQAPKLRRLKTFRRLNLSTRRKATPSSC